MNYEKRLQYPEITQKSEIAKIHNPVRRAGRGSGVHAYLSIE